jgi:cytochrome c-type biogenesis protein CcmH
MQGRFSPLVPKGNLPVTAKNASDIVSALRTILQARAEGKMTTEEFERRQAEVHAIILSAAPTETNVEPVVTAAHPPRAPSDGQGNPARLWILLPVAAVTIAAAGLYFWLDKSRSAPAKPAENLQASDTGARKVDSAQVDQQLAALAAEVAKNPMNGEAWASLARSYAHNGQHTQAADAFAKAAAILPPDAALLGDWADSFVVAHNRQWDDTSRGLIKRALAADPKHLKSLSLAATDAFDNADYAGAIAYWKRMKFAATNDAAVNKYADDNIAEATAAMSGKNVTSTSPAGAEPVSGAKTGSGAIAGTIAISEKLRGRISPTDTIFVLAKNSEGQGPPLAAKRYTVADLPVEFRLDDDASMIPGQGLSRVIEAVVIARVSKSGNPVAQPGDLESAPQRVKVGAHDLKVEINSVR